MTITLELNWTEAIAALELARDNPINIASDQLITAIKEAMESENERAWESRQQSLRESGGVDDSTYRRDMRDAGRGHLIR